MTDNFEKENKLQLLSMTSDIVCTYISQNEMEADKLPDLIRNVYRTLESPSSYESEPSSAVKPAVPVNKSIQDDYLICLEDGKKLKMLKRYIKTNYDMTPEEYRERWNLPRSYPMVAPNYAKKRSKLAKNIGLGTKENTEKSKNKGSKRGRPKKNAA